MFVCAYCSAFWSVAGWLGPWLLTLSSGVRQQTASQLDISISKTLRTPHMHIHTHTTSKIPSLLLLVSHFLLLWMVGWFMSAEKLQPFISP